MNDPRDEVIDSDDCLTEDSSDELKDLVKEFELKYEKLKAQKKLKKLHQKEMDDKHLLQLHKPSQTEVPKTPEKEKNKNKEVNELIFYKRQSKEQHPSTTTKEPSNFLSKLYATNHSGKSINTGAIDYSKRKFYFELENYKQQPINVIDELEPISRIYLRKRYFTSSQIEEIISSINEEEEEEGGGGTMKFIKVEKLLAKTNKSNNYSEPQYTNWCFVGFILHKSPIQTASNNAKYMKLRVGNFINSIEIMLFDKAVEKYFKMQPGDLLFILNPFINKYEIQIAKGQFKSGFNLKIDNSNLSSILEVGAIRDFGICKYIKKNDNTRCNNVINIKNQELCDIHMDMKFKSNTRMELNGSVAIRSPKKGTKKMYMDSNGAGYIKQFNEDTNVIGYGNSAPFDNRRYQDSKILLTQNKRRKLIDERANELLEKKLKKMGSRSLLTNLQLSHSSPTPTGDTSKGTKTSGIKRLFTNSMLSQIGYDPTGASTAGGIDFNKEKTISQELRQLSTSSNKSLSSSKEDRRQRIAKWRANALEQKKSEQIKKDTTLIDHRRRVIQTTEDLDTDNDNDDDDDDDLDIKFDNPEEKNQYSQILSGSQ